MTSTSRALLTVAATLTVMACSEGEQAAGTEDLNRTLLAQPAGDGRSTPIAADPSLVDEGQRVTVSEVGVNRGEASALVKVVEMSDYGCGYCRKFHEETFPVLRSQFIETGMVEWKFVPYITGMFDNSLAATEAAECTLVQDLDAFETLNGRLWNEQAAWKRGDEPEAVVRGWVSELGIDMDAFDSCVADDEQLSRVAASTTLARQIGVRGTPTFIVVGYPPLQGALPTETFQQILAAVHEEAMREAGDAGDGGP
jgi:protein-disulfide isomerase